MEDGGMDKKRQRPPSAPWSPEDMTVTLSLLRQYLPKQFPFLEVQPLTWVKGGEKSAL